MRVARLLGTALLAAALPVSSAAAAVSFATTGTADPGTDLTSLHLVDMDGDGHLDIVTGATGGGGRVRIRLGDGSGGFTSPAGLTDQTTGHAALVVVADADGDGRQDLLTADDSGSAVRIWHRLPGTPLAFESVPTTVIDAAVGGRVRGITVADVTGDGARDLIVAGSGSVRYEPQVGGAYPAGYAGYVSWFGSAGVRIGDIDADGHPDLLSMDDPLAPSSWQLMTEPIRNGGPDMSGSAAYGLPGAPRDLLLTDLDGDGSTDAVIGRGDGTSAYPLDILWNNGTYFPDYTSGPAFGASIGISQLATADVDGDGIGDLVAATSAGPRLLLGRASRVTPFSAPVAIGGGLSGDQVTVGDVDEDGRPDLVSASPAGVEVRLNTSTVDASVAVDAPFGATVIGGHTDRTLTVTNTGSSLLRPGAPTITGTDAARVTVTGSTCTTWLTVGASCTVALRFTPLTRAALTAAVSFPAASPTPDSALTLTLSGTGLAPGMLDGPATADAGSIGVGDSATRTLTYTNTGDVSITPSAATITGSPSWTITGDTCAATIAAAATCTVTVAVTPADRGAQDATLHISGLTTSLHAVGLSPGELTGPPSLDIDPITVGRSTTRELVFTNIGDQPLTPPAATITGSSAWTVTTDGCAAPLAAYTSCTVTVTATPTTPGTADAALHIGAVTTTLHTTGVAAPVTGDRDPDPVTTSPITPTPTPTTPVTTPPAPTATAPRITAQPRITFRGPLRPGTRLTATATATGTPAATLTYRWQRCRGTRCTPAGTGKRHTVGTADTGRRLTVTVTARNTAGTTTAASRPTAVVRGRTA